jgi:hypothetical protein
MAALWQAIVTIKAMAGRLYFGEAPEASPSMPATRSTPSSSVQNFAWANLQYESRGPEQVKKIMGGKPLRAPALKLEDREKLHCSTLGGSEVSQSRHGIAASAGSASCHSPHCPCETLSQ